MITENDEDADDPSTLQLLSSGCCLSSSLIVSYSHLTSDWFQFGFLSMLFLLHIHHISHIKFSTVVLYSSHHRLHLEPTLNISGSSILNIQTENLQAETSGFRHGCFQGLPPLPPSDPHYHLSFLFISLLHLCFIILLFSFKSYLLILI